MKVNFRRILYYLFPHVQKYWTSLFFVFFGYSVGVVFDAILKPLVFKKIIDLFSSGNTGILVLNQSLYYFVFICIIIVIHNIGFRAGDFSIAHFESKMMKSVYDFTFQKLLNHSYHFFSNNFSGSLIAKSRRLTKSVETLFDIISFQIWFSFVTIVAILFVLFPRVPILGYLFLGWSVLYILLTTFFIRRKIFYDTIEASADSNVTGRFSDVITNVLNIKIFSGRGLEERKFFAITDDEEKKRRKAWYSGNIQNLFQSLMMAFLQVTVLFINIHFLYVGKISLGLFVLVQTYMFSLFDILWNLGRSLTRAVKALTDMQEVIDIFDTPIDISDPKNPKKFKIIRGEVSFDNVNFLYRGGVSVFENFNLKIFPNEHIGLVGHSGAGKSTITKLLLRFNDVSSGKITIDGQDIREVTQDDLRSIISYVPQESILFHRTLAENIAYGKPDANEEEIIEVAKKAHAHEFISKLPLGYDTLVGERGIKLSGGERQRIAIARAMLKNAPILILDEATSSLDSVSEKYIQDALGELMKGKTTIVIAHRLSTIQKMDRILVLDGGKIAEEGSHAELLEKKGIYADLWNHQTGGFLE